MRGGLIRGLAVNLNLDLNLVFKVCILVLSSFFSAQFFL